MRREAIVCPKGESGGSSVELLSALPEYLKVRTYWVDQNIIGDLEVGRRYLTTDNVHRSLRRYIYSLMSPSSSRVQPKRNRDQRQCRKNNRLHRTTMSQCGERVFPRREGVCASVL